MKTQDKFTTQKSNFAESLLLSCLFSRSLARAKGSWGRGLGEGVGAGGGEAGVSAAGCGCGREVGGRGCVDRGSGGDTDSQKAQGFAIYVSCHSLTLV